MFPRDHCYVQSLLTTIQFQLLYIHTSCPGDLLHPLGRQDNEDLDRLIVAADTGLLWLTCLLFDSEWFWDSLMDSWTDYLMSPFEDYPLNLDAQ